MRSSVLSSFNSLSYILINNHKESVLNAVGSALKATLTQQITARMSESTNINL